MATKQIPAKEDITLVQGDTFEFDYVVKADGSAVDFSTHSQEKMQIRKNDRSPLKDEYSTSAGTLTTTAGGRVTATWTSAQTVAWPKTCKYEFQTETSGSNIRTYQKGTITVNRQITE